MSSALSAAFSGDDQGSLDDLLKLHVREAVRSRSHAGSGSASIPYSSLVNQLRAVKEQVLRDENEDQVEQLISILDALTACVSSLHERNHETLIHEVLTIPIWKTCQGVRTALLRLLIHMVVANSALVPLCLRVLVLAMQPPSAPLKANEVATVALAPWQPDANIMDIQNEVIAALTKILRLVPTAPSRMVSTVAGGIPFKLRDRETQCTYLHGALQLAEAPDAVAVREGILAAAVTHLLGLDVEIRWQDIAAAEAEAEEEEGESEREEEDIFALEGETEHLHLSTPGQPQEQPNQERMQGRGGWEGAARGADAAETSASGRPASSETAEKLDALMDLVFKHLEHRCEQGQLSGAWATLLHTFEQSILDTHRSKFTQYLLWYLCRQGPQQCSASLLQLLLQRLTNPNVAPITRSAAAAYLASFLARASFIPEPLLLQTLQGLAGWCLSYCRDQNIKDVASGSVITTAHTSTRLDLDAGPAKGIQHQVFYAACQALLYVLCYRLDHLMAASQPVHGLESTSPNGVLNDAAVHAQLRQLFVDTIPQILNHRLAPLSVCLPTVVAEFSRLVSRLGLMDCGALLPQRAQAMRAQRPLEMFFPFDPYLLRRSAQYLDLEKTYVRWKQGHPQAIAQDNPDNASDVSSEEGVNPGSDSDDGEKAAGSDEEDSDLSLGSSNSGASDEEDARMDMAPRRLAQRLRHKAWPPPLGGVGRPVSAQPSSRKRAASGTPGSDQGFLPGASFDTNSISGASLHGPSPGVSPPGMQVAMSWTQQANRTAALRMQRALEQPIDAK